MDKANKNCCKNCGKELQEDWAFCPYCGVPVPTDIEALFESGEAYRKKGQYAEAIRDLDEALRLDPDNLFAEDARKRVYREWEVYKAIKNH